MLQKIILHVAIFRPFLRIPMPDIALSALLAFPILSSTPEVLSAKIEVFTPTWSYSTTSCTLAGPSLKSLFLEFLTSGRHYTFSARI